MGVLVSKDTEVNSKLNERISADLRAKASQNELMSDDPDGVEDSDYVKDLKKTSKHGWIWIVLIVLAAASLTMMIIM